MNERVDISSQLKAICEALDLRYDRLHRLEIEPSSVTATFFLDNDEGRILVAEGEAAHGIRTFGVKT